MWYRMFASIFPGYLVLRIEIEIFVEGTWSIERCGTRWLVRQRRCLTLRLEGVPHTESSSLDGF